MSGENLDLAAGAMDNDDLQSAKTYKQDTYVPKMTAKSSAIRHCGVKKYLEPQQVESLLADIGAKASLVQPKARKPGAKSTWSWTEQHLKTQLPKVVGCTITEVRNSRYTGWTGRYPGVKPGSRSKQFGHGISSETAAAHVFGWLWSTHSSVTGEEIPHDVTGWETL